MSARKRIYNVICRFRVFTRVLPLPNGNWNTLVDDWCCHADPFANKKLLPQQEDCLLGDTYFLLTRDSSCDQSLARVVDSSDVNTGSDLHSGKVRHIEKLTKIEPILNHANSSSILSVSQVVFELFSWGIRSSHSCLTELCSIYTASGLTGAVKKDVLSSL